MMKHAPGKWIVNKYDNGFSIYAGHFRWAERFEVNPSPERLARHIANATLMAEAPVLLAVCEAIAALADGQGRANLLDCAGQARAVIAKAKGE